MRTLSLLVAIFLCINLVAAACVGASPKGEAESSPAPQGTVPPTVTYIPTVVKTSELFTTPEWSTVTFTPIEGDVVNPERGFRYSFDDLRPDTDFSTYRMLGTSLVYSYVRLDDYRETDLPPELLQRVQDALDAVRAGGVKVILRFAYNFGPYPNSEPDASKEQILRHIEQLKPVLQRNADVIAWMHAGFIGAWGEWHTSTHGLDKDMQAKKEILYALLDALPQDRMVQLRYPWDIIRLFPEPLSGDQAFTGSPQARVGFHNDCFLSSETDVGTYDRGGRNTRQEDQAYLQQMTQFTPAGGETCQVYPPLQQCDVAIREMELLHFSDLNLSYHPRVIRNWQREGCFDEIQKRLGYRLVLEEAKFPVTLHPGMQLEVHVKLRNEGFAAPVNPRPIFLVLDGPTTLTFPLEDVDPRRWLPGEHTIRVRLDFPKSIPSGTYTLALWLPDPYETLRDDPRYSIRFANENVWDEEHGWNVIGSVQIP